MPNTNGDIVARKVLPIIYVIDTSGSMEGIPIAQVNQGMESAVEVMREVAAANADADIQIGVLTFSSGTEWAFPGLKKLEDFYFNPLTAGGLTDLGDALYELADKMSRSKFFISETGFKNPVLIFMSDGDPTDNWEKAYDAAMASNRWFSHATKIAIAIGEDANKEVLAKVVGNREAVIQVNDPVTLKKLIRVVSASASIVNSQSPNPDVNLQNAVIDRIGTEMDDQPGVEIPDPIPAPDPVPVPDSDSAPSLNPAPTWEEESWQ